MRKSPTVCTPLIGATVLLLWSASAHAQERALNRVADGDFETSAVSLSLPAAAQFPMFSGGWASRGNRVPETVDRGAFDGAASLRLVTAPDDPLQLLQDVPFDSVAYGLRFAFLIEEGSQSVRLLSGRDRGTPEDGTVAFEARLSVNEVVFSTPAGSWRVAADIAAGEWHALNVISDPRTDSQHVRLDGQPLVTLPGPAARRPSTIILAAGAGDAGTVRYDAVELISLVDLELLAVRDAVARLDIAAKDAVLDRLSAAATALQRGSETLALPELGVARNMLAATASASENLRLAIAELIDLIEAGSDRPERGRAAQF